MGLNKQLFIAMVGLILASLAIGGVALAWNAAHSEMNDTALVVATAVGAEYHQPTLNHVTDNLLTGTKASSIRVVDSELATIALSVAGNATLATELSDQEATSLGEAIEQKRADTYVDGDILKLVAP